VARRITFDAERLSRSLDEFPELIGIPVSTWKLMSETQRALAVIEYGLESAEKAIEKAKNADT
jgi:hypothetical protein